MSITIGGHTWRTLEQPLYAGGQLVKEVYADGVKVYPESNDLYIEVQGRGHERLKFYFDFEHLDPEESYMTSDVMAQFTAVVKFSNSNGDPPEWSFSDGKLTVLNADSVGVVDANSTYVATPVSPYSGLGGIADVIDGLGGYYNTYLPLDIICAFNGGYFRKDGNGSLGLYYANIRDVGAGTIARRFPNAKPMSLGDLDSDWELSTDYESHASLAVTKTFENNVNKYVMTKAVFKYIEIFDLRRHFLNPWGDPGPDQYELVLRTKYVDANIYAASEVPEPIKQNGR